MRHPARVLVCAIVLFAPAFAGAAPLQPDASLPAEVRLSEEEKEKVLEAAAASRQDEAAKDTSSRSENLHRRPILGEVGFSVGTGGYRSAYGTAYVPLTGTGMAIISLGSTDLGRRRARWPD